MATGEFRIFLSAVTSEFGQARDALAADLRSRGLIVKVQSDFRQEAESDTTLHKLHDYIRDCGAVICIIGQRSGACPPPAAVVPFAHMLPRSVPEASYTQWEFFFAQHNQRRLSLYIAREDYSPDQPVPTGADSTELQQAFVRYIVQEQGLDRSSFSNTDQLCRAVLKEDWPNFSRVDLRQLRIFENVPPRDLNFTGREGVLSQLHQILLHPGQPQAVMEVAIHGLAGIGKTSLAAEYVYRHAGEYAGVWWAAAENRTVLLASLAALAGRIEPGLAEEANQEKAARAGLAHLVQSAMPFLLVYDNAEAPEVLRDLVPSAGTRVLVTTRWADWGGRAAELELEALQLEAAVAFLQKRSKRTDEAGATQLAEALGCLPLALDHAGAYCRLSGLSFEAYRKKIDSRIAKAPEGAAYPASVAATFGLAFEQAAARQPAAEAVLGFSAFLAPDRIPLDLIASEIEDEDEQAEALMTLTAVSLVEHVELSGGEAAISLHRLVQAAMRAGLANQGQTAAITERVIHRLVEAFPDGAYNKTDVWPRCAVLLPHVLALRNHMHEDLDSVELVELLSAAGNYLHGRGSYAEAEPLLKDAVAVCEKTLGREHAGLATQLSNLAYLYYSCGRYAEAEPLYKEAITIGEKTLGHQHSNNAVWLSNLALLYRATGRYAEAEPLYKEAIAIGESTLGRQHTTVAGWLNNLAYLYYSTGRYAEAEPLFQEVVATSENTLGHRHPHVSIQLGNLADLYRDTGRCAEAEPLYKEAISISEATLGREHPVVATQLSNFAELYRLSGHYAEAEPLINEAIAIGRKVFGQLHPNMAGYLNNLALLLRDMGRFNEAELSMQETIMIGEKTLGRQHPTVIGYINNLAKLFTMGDRQASAATLQARYGLPHE